MSELETGYGRSDLIVMDPSAMRCLILELKHVHDEREMAGAMKKAVNQIERKKYESQAVYQGYTKRLQYGLVFCGKKAAAVLYS